MYDCEDQLEYFSIRRNLAEGDNLKCCSHAPSSSKVKVHHEIPLLICDLANLSQNNDNKPLIYKFGASFQKCIVYGRVVEKFLNNKKFYKYLIDDSTGCIEIRIFRRQSDFEAVSRLEAAIACLKNTTQLKEILCSLRSISGNIKDKLNLSNIPIGKKIVICGKPTVLSGKVIIDVISICSDERLIPLLEMEIKDFHIKSYIEQYKIKE